MVDPGRPVKRAPDAMARERGADDVVPARDDLVYRACDVAEGAAGPADGDASL